jgi:hypothetical protein
LVLAKVFSFKTASFFSDKKAANNFEPISSVKNFLALKILISGDYPFFILIVYYIFLLETPRDGEP